MKLKKQIRLNLFSLLIFILIFVAIIYSVRNTLAVGANFFLGNIAIRESFFHENNINYKGTHEPGKRFMNILQEYYLKIMNLDILDIKEVLQMTKNINISKTEYFLEYRLIKTLIRLSRLPNSQKKISAIYIPKKIHTYWNISCDSLMAPFIIPAITNITLIDGLPMNNIKSCYGHRREYGYARYIEYNKSASLEVLSPKDLCLQAKKDDLKQVIEIIETDNKEYFDTKIYKCEKY